MKNRFLYHLLNWEEGATLQACRTYRCCDPAKKTDTCWAKTCSHLYLIRSLKEILRFIVYEGITEHRWVKPIIKTYREWKSPGHARAAQV